MISPMTESLNVGGLSSLGGARLLGEFGNFSEGFTLWGLPTIVLILNESFGVPEIKPGFPEC